MNQIGLTWTASSNGGSTIIDYTIYYDQSTGIWITLATGVTTTYYTTNVTITSGREYQFIIVARNDVGYSQNSSVISIVAA